MRANHRLRKLEQSRGGSIHVGLMENRDGHDATDCGVTHAPHQGKIYARADYDSDAAFWVAVDGRTLELGVQAVWIAPELAEI